MRYKKTNKKYVSFLAPFKFLNAEGAEMRNTRKGEGTKFFGKLS